MPALPWSASAAMSEAASWRSDAERARRSETAMKSDQALREHVLYLLGGGGAHVDFERAIAKLPVAKRGVRPAGLPHSPWRLVEHMRIAQSDIVEFCRNPRHVSPK